MGADRGEIFIVVHFYISLLDIIFFKLIQYFSGIHIDVPADQMTTFQVTKKKAKLASHSPAPTLTGLMPETVRYVLLESSDRLAKDWAKSKFTWNFS